VRLGDRAESLELTASFWGTRSTIHPVVLWEGRDGATLIDAGYPGQMPAIERALGVVGVKLHDLKRILLTHQDLDHIGSAETLVAATGAEVFAHAADTPYIQGEKRLVKMDPARFEERLKMLPERRRDRARRMIASLPSVKVNRTLQGNERLPLHGGIDVIATPGHTPGHVCYYVRQLRLLVAGDALRVEGGELMGPSPAATPDMAGALASLRNLLSFPVNAVLCYHGGLYDKPPADRLRELMGGDTDQESS
jgi:glyoxylase-like metal-dependent hydrolase (beta-lactamase superfamily II)